jgi:hypothetical protein
MATARAVKSIVISASPAKVDDFIAEATRATSFSSQWNIGPQLMRK